MAESRRAEEAGEESTGDDRQAVRGGHVDGFYFPAETNGDNPPPSARVSRGERFTLDHAFSGIGGRESAVNLARLGATTDNRLEQLVDLWDKASEEDRASKRRYLEALCQRCHLDPSEFLGICVAIAHRHQVDVVNLVTAAALDDVVAAGLRAAKLPGGTRDRALIYEHKGLIQKGPGIAVQINNQAAGGLPDFKAISEIALAATQPKQLPAAEKDYVDAESV